MNYKLMNKNIEVLEFSYDKVTHTVTNIIRVIHPDYAPLGIIEYKRGITRKAMNNWWKDRSIPASRSRFKEVMAEMVIHSSVELLERCFDLSLSDQYWIKEKNSDIEWKDISFFENDLYYSACPTMVNTDEELVPAYYIDRTIKQRGNDSLYMHFLEACKSLNITTLEWIGIVPIFDSGSSLWATQPTSAIGSTYMCKTIFRRPARTI